MPTHRRERLADQIRDEVAELVAADLKDPRIGLATVTRVELSGDLHHAKVMVSVLGDKAAEQETMKGLSSAVGYVRRQVAQRLRLRRAPEVVFVLDRGAKAAENVETLLEHLKPPGNEAA